MEMCPCFIMIVTKKIIIEAMISFNPMKVVSLVEAFQQIVVWYLPSG